MNCITLTSNRLISLMQASTTGDTGWADEVRHAQATRTVNIVCMKWGTRYGPEWVDRLYGMVMRNTSWTVRFVCLTDDGTGIRPEVEIKPLSSPAVLVSGIATGPLDEKSTSRKSASSWRESRSGSPEGAAISVDVVSAAATTTMDQR